MIASKYFREKYPVNFKDTSIEYYLFAEQRATYRENHKVRTNAYIYLLEGHEYEFMCNGKEKPWYMEIKTDDNTKFFADRCSFDFQELDDKKAKKRLGKEIGKSAPAGNKS